MKDVVVGLDGHDGAGKTTLARAAAEVLGAEVVRPFAGAAGSRLMAAATAGEISDVLEIGSVAIRAALDSRTSGRSLVLDRSWVTVATLVPREVFVAEWDLWPFTIVCWADLPTTLRRVRTRDEPQERDDWHRGYIDLYAQLAAELDVPLVRTDDRSVDRALAHVLELSGHGVGELD